MASGAIAIPVVGVAKGMVQTPANHPVLLVGSVQIVAAVIERFGQRAGAPVYLQDLIVTSGLGNL